MSLALVHFNLGAEFQNTGDIAEAERCYEKALRADPQFAPARKNLASLHLEKGTRQHNAGDLVGAEFHYRQALSQDPRCLMARQNLSAIASVRYQSLPQSAALAEIEPLCETYRILLSREAGAEDEPVPIGGEFETALGLGALNYIDLLMRSDRIDEAVDYQCALVGEHDRAGLIAALEQRLLREGRVGEAIALNDATFAVELRRFERAIGPSARVDLELFLARHRELERSRRVFAGEKDHTLRDLTYALEPNLKSATFRFRDGQDLASCDSALAAAGPAIAAANPLLRRKRIVSAMLVRDEIDLLSDTIACHLNQGVDLVMVTDNGSVDGSRELLAELEQSLPVQVIDEPAQNYDQALWMTRMVHLACDQHGAEWVVCADADELWRAVGGDIAQCIAHDLAIYGAETRLILCQQSTIIPERARSTAPSYRPTDEGLALTRPLRRLRYVDRSEVQCYNALHKSIVHTDGFVSLWYGNHFAAFRGPARHAYSSHIDILHFRVRSREQLRRKLANTIAAQTLNPSFLAVQNLSDEAEDSLFDSSSYPTQFFIEMRARGRLEEFRDLAAIRDRSLPQRSCDDSDAEELRRQAALYFAMIEPSLPRAGSVA